MDDSVITGKVKASVFNDPALKSAEISKEVDPDWDIHQRAGMDAIGNTRWAKGTPRRGRLEPKEQAAGIPVGELSHSSV